MTTASCIPSASPETSLALSRWEDGRQSSEPSEPTELLTVKQIRFTLGPNSTISQAQRIHTNSSQEHPSGHVCPPVHQCPTAKVVSYSSAPSASESHMTYARAPGMPGVAIASGAENVSYWLMPLGTDDEETRGSVNFVLEEGWDLSITARDRPFWPTAAPNILSGDNHLTLTPYGTGPISIQVGEPPAHDLLPSRQCASCGCTCFDDDSPNAWYLKPGSVVLIEVASEAQNASSVVKAADDPTWAFSRQPGLPSRHRERRLLAWQD